MVGFYETEYDGDGNPEGVSHMQEEPDCYACCDGGYVPAGRLGRLVGRRSIGCPSCNPNRLTVLYQRSRLWKVRGWLRRLGVLPEYRGELSDEPPF